MKVPKFIPPFWLLPCLLLMFVFDTYLPIVEWLPSPWHYIGFIPIVISLLITGASAKRLNRSGTTVSPFKTSTKLITSGLYQYSRNPMYLGMTLILFGSALFFGSITALIPIPLYMWVIKALFIIPEEDRLRTTFGDDFDIFCQQVRRWI